MNAPSPLVVGGVMAKGSFPTDFVGTVKLDKTVVNELTLNSAVIVEDV